MIYDANGNIISSDSGNLDNISALTIGGDYTFEPSEIIDNKYYDATNKLFRDNNDYEVLIYDIKDFVGKEISIDAVNGILAKTTITDDDGNNLITEFIQTSVVKKVIPKGATKIIASNQKSHGGKCYIHCDNLMNKFKKLEDIDILKENEINTRVKVSSKPFKISFNGDSITEGTTSSKSNTYVNTVVTDLMISDFENNGKCGQSISYIKTTAEKQTDADVITVLAGTNNFGQDISSLKSQFSDMIVQFRQNNTDYEDKLFLLITPIKRFDKEDSYRLEEIADMIVEVGKEYDIPVLDMYHYSGIEENTYEKYLLDDKLHPTDDGAIFIGHSISDFIAKSIFSKYCK